MNTFGEMPRFKRSEIVYYKEGRFGPRRQGNLQLVYIFEGEALVSINGNTEYLGEGEATLLLPGREELFLFSRNQRTWHGWCEIVQPSLSSEVVSRLDALPFRTPISGRMRELDTMISSVDPASSGLFNSLAQSLFYEYFSVAGLDFGAEADVSMHPAVCRAIEFISNRCCEAVGLEEIAAYSGVSGAHLIRLFKSDVGKTPANYLWLCRVDAAAHLLANTGLSSAEVAYRCGFANPAHFSRRFKQEMSITPGAYRRKTWGM